MGDHAFYNNFRKKDDVIRINFCSIKYLDFSEKRKKAVLDYCIYLRNFNTNYLDRVNHSIYNTVNVRLLKFKHLRIQLPDHPASHYYLRRAKYFDFVSLGLSYEQTSLIRIQKNMVRICLVFLYFGVFYIK